MYRHLGVAVAVNVVLQVVARREAVENVLPEVVVPT